MAKHDKKQNNGNNNAGQPVPLSGSHKVKNRQHSRQKQKSGHDM